MSFKKNYYRINKDLKKFEDVLNTSQCDITNSDDVWVLESFDDVNFETQISKSDVNGGDVVTHTDSNSRNLSRQNKNKSEVMVDWYSRSKVSQKKISKCHDGGECEFLLFYILSVVIGCDMSYL